MRKPTSAFSLLLVSLLGLAVLVGCASSDVTARRQASGSQDVAKPQRIIVHNFAGTPADLPPDSAIAEHYARRSQPQTAKEIEIGRKLGAQVAAELVTEIELSGRLGQETFPTTAQFG